jgi:hypothetical protein
MVTQQTTNYTVVFSSFHGFSQIRLLLLYLHRFIGYLASHTQAIALVQTKGPVLTTAEIAPHLTHRPVVKLTSVYSPPHNLAEFDYILLDVTHPGWQSNREFATNLVNQLNNTQLFQLRYQRDGVYLFVKEVFHNSV